MTATVDLPELNVREELEKNRNNPGYVGKSVYEATSISEAGDILSIHKRKNIILNGDFNVWQRGTSFGPSTGSEFTADRWFSNPSGATINITRESFVRGQEEVPGNPKYFLRIASISGSADNVGITQRIEDIDRYSNVDVTVSFWARTVGSPEQYDISMAMAHIFTGGSSDLNINKKDTIDGRWKKITASYHMPSLDGKTNGANPHFRFFITIPTSIIPTIDISRVQLEFGKQATEFETVDPGLELSLLQRYYQKSYDVDVDPGTITLPGSLFEAGARNASGFTIGSRFKNSMRKLPTVTIYSTATGASGNISNSGDKAAVPIRVGDNGFAGVAITSGNQANNAEFHFTADAEI